MDIDLADGRKALRNRNHPKDVLLKVVRRQEGFMEGWWLTALGFVAGICTTFSFVPQLLKAWRSTDTEAISKRTYLMSTGAFALWIVHGVMMGGLPIIVFNALSFALSGAILALKLRAQNNASTA